MKTQSYWPLYSGNGRAISTNEFYDTFRYQVVPELGEDIYRLHGPTYMTLLVTNARFKDRLHEAFNELKGIEETPDMMERTFLKVRLTEEGERGSDRYRKDRSSQGRVIPPLRLQDLSVLVKQYRIQEDNRVILILPLAK